MGNMRPFQVILMGVFLAMALGGLLVFAFFEGFIGNQNPYGNKVEIWGTFDDATFSQVIEKIKESNENFHVVYYVQKDARTFEQDLVNALANGKGPDLVVMPQTMILANRQRLFPIPFASLPLRNFKDAYIDGADIFLLDGVYGLPIAVDPIVLYWNRDIFASKGLAQPPRTWEELVAVTLPAIVERDFSFNITRAALAFGEYANIRNAKEILALLFMQAGSLMVYDSGGGRLAVEIDRGLSVKAAPPAAAGLRFYTEFSNPQKTVYTWNRSLPQDRDEFYAEDLAMYFGFASEVEAIRRGNPNLNFDVTEVPQGADATLKKGYGNFYAMALIRNTPNRDGAIKALYELTTPELTKKYATDLGLGTVYRSSHLTAPADPFFATVERAALVARGWLDPGEGASDNIFKQMIEDVTSGRLDVSQAIGDSNGRLRLLLGD